MKKIISIFAVALIAMSCACSDKQDKKNDTIANKTSALQDESKTMRVGAFADQKELTEDDKLVFEEALKDFKTDNKYTCISVAKQIVAGTNYLFICDVVSKDGAKSKEEVLIFKPLPHTKNPIKIIKIDKIK